MDLRIIVLCLACWISPVLASTLQQVEQLNPLVFQYPSKALSQISALEKHFFGVPNSSSTLTHLAALKCEALVQVGDNMAAIRLARVNEAKSKRLSLNTARPYFLNCLVQAYANVGDYQQALPLLHTSIKLARQLQQPQALINGLWLRSQLSTRVNHNNAAIEDLRLALDIYPEIELQKQQWTWPPKGTLYAAIGGLLAGMGETKEATIHLRNALNEQTTKGKVRLFAALEMTKFAQQNRLPEEQAKYRQVVNTQLDELGSPLELASAYKAIARIDFDGGKYNSATQLLHFSLSTFQEKADIVGIIDTLWLSANLKLQQGDEENGIALMQQAIALALENKRYIDLKNSYASLAEYFAKQKQFTQAYQYQLKQLDALEKETEALKQTWMSLLKVDVNQAQQATSQTHPFIAATTTSEGLPLWFIPIALLIIGLLIYFHWYQTKASMPDSLDHVVNNLEAKVEPQKALEDRLSLSQQAGYPLSLLVFNPHDIHAADVPMVLEQLKTKLRGQDIWLQQSDRQILIMLPHTTKQGAAKVINQLNDCMAMWQDNIKIAFGLAAMQQFDNLQSMIKRAKISQLSNQKAC
ncbi:histidine kinase [Shewanella youngdeokensis]|uniref:Histidine kinase n=1 Tax=Shewanella youngdeokensis TaxID=2999068 RepID=A0ABZ0JZU7_9GAMM|nr:histidine kinase [Shewanella sp. DAU334]